MEKKLKKSPVKAIQPVSSKRVTKVQQPVQVAQAPVQIIQPVHVPVKTDAEKMWDELKDVRLEMFALPNQVVSNYYKPIFIEPSKLYLTALTRASSVLPAFELALQPKYSIELVDRFVVVSKK